MVYTWPMTVIPISQVVSHTRCPSCSNRNISRTSSPIGVDLEGATLWEVTESCMMCEWSSSTADVKVGV